MGPYFCSDDSRFASPSQNAAITLAKASSAYATQNRGTSFEQRRNSKSTILVNPPEALDPHLKAAIKGTWLGGEPEIVDDTKSLGIQERTGRPSSITVLTHIEQVGGAAAMTMCRRTIQLR